MWEEKSLFPVVDIPDFTEVEETYDANYRPSLSWDLEAGDFVRGPDHRVQSSSGLDAYKTWCLKTVSTERYHCLAYDNDIGTEMEDAVKEEDDNAVELAVQRTIEEALMVNPRTESVEDFTFSWEPDSLTVTLWVYSVGWESFPIEFTINR